MVKHQKANISMDASVRRNTFFHIPFLDGFRGLAVLAVYLYHTLDPAFVFRHLHWNGVFRDFEVSLRIHAALHRIENESNLEAYV